MPAKAGVLSARKMRQQIGLERNVCFHGEERKQKGAQKLPYFPTGLQLRWRRFHNSRDSFKTYGGLEQ